MRVLHVITDLGQGGAETVLFRLVSASINNIEHRVVSLHSAGVYGPALEAAGVSVDSLEMPRGRVTSASVAELRRIVREFRPDVIQTRLYHADLLGCIAASTTTKAPVVWAMHSTELGSLRSAWKTRGIRRLCAMLSYVLPSSLVYDARGTAEVHARIGYDRRKFVVIPNGVDLVQFRPDEAGRVRLRKEIGAKPMTAVVGLLARWDPLKDHATLLEAVAIVARRQPSLLCVLAGSKITADNPALMSLVRQNGLAEKVVLLGPRADAAAILNGLDVHVLSSHAESAPVAVVEAMACGTPCVVTDVGDTAKIVGDTGWIVPPRDPQALAAAIEAALAAIAKSGRAHVGDRGRARIAAHFSIDEMVNAYRRVWEAVIA